MNGRFASSLSTEKERGAQSPDRQQEDPVSGCEKNQL